MAKPYNSLYIVVPALVATVLLSSCASYQTDPFVVDEQAADVQKTGKQKFAAWDTQALSNSNGVPNPAVSALLSQADVFILYNALTQASDKLERILRIQPTYAPTWSRLSWIALQSHSLERAKQMAQRSNSYAQDNKELKILNWSFIRQASLKMNDPDAVQHAEKMIETLEGS